MIERTRILGPELVSGLERMDEVLQSHEGKKKQKWKTQTWREHAERAIKHLQLALDDAEDGTEIEAAHGAVRALMAITFIRTDMRIEPHLCAEHATSD